MTTTAVPTKSPGRTASWAERAFIAAVFLAYAFVIWRFQAPLFDSCEPCSAATLRLLARNSRPGFDLLTYSAALLLPLLGLAGVVVTVLWRRFSSLLGVLFLIVLLALALLDLKLLAYF